MGDRYVDDLLKDEVAVGLRCTLEAILYDV